ncbi:hypothetical protein AGMMS50230_00470 [Spirochaetia bacterium]|nr:hypothetical protein AGMMS50230_00470 [Spirochaetia bacterium]
MQIYLLALDTSKFCGILEVMNKKNVAGNEIYTKQMLSYPPPPIIPTDLLGITRPLPLGPVCAVGRFSVFA